MPLIKWLKGDEAGRYAYLDFHSIQQAEPGALEQIPGYDLTSDPKLLEELNSVDVAERGATTRSTVAARDLSEEHDPTLVSTAGHGAAGPDAARMGSSTVHRSEALATPPAPFVHPTAAPVDPKQAQAASERAAKVASDRVDGDNKRVESAAKRDEQARKTAERTQADMTKSADKARK